MSPKLENALARGVLALLDAVKDDAGWATFETRMECRDAGREIAEIMDAEEKQRQADFERKERGEPFP